MNTHIPSLEIQKQIWIELYNPKTWNKVSEISLWDLNNHEWDLEKFLDTQAKTGRYWKIVSRKEKS